MKLLEPQSACPYVRKVGVGRRLAAGPLQVVGPVEVLALVAPRPLQSHAVLQTPLDGQDAGRVGVTQHGARLGVGREVVQGHLEVHLVVDLRRKQNRDFRF